MIHWGEPSVLLALAALPPMVVWLAVCTRRARSSAAAEFADSEMLARLMPAPSIWRPRVKAVAMTLSVACVVVAGARPRSGVSLQTTSHRSADLVVLLDVSQSMLAEDVPPNRLGAAKAAIRSLLDESRGDRVGLVVFAGKAVLKAPLTADLGFVREILDDIDTQSAPRGGTRIGEAILKGLETLPSSSDCDQILVLITDGEDHESKPNQAATQAAGRKVRIVTTSVGDTGAGARIPRIDASGRRTFLRYEGQEVLSKANEGLLREIATLSGGIFVPTVGSGSTLGAEWRELLGSLHRTEIREEKRVSFTEQFQWFLGIGIVLLMADLAIPRYPRRAKTARKEEHR